jgi:chemotaxis signal transduction protein
VIVSVQGLQMAVSARHVREITRTPRWHAVPNAPRFVRGVVNLRGRVLPLVDLRVRLGLPSALEEVEAMIAMLEERERDHILWLRELQRAVDEGRPFTLPRDPTQCAFGQWYYSYKPEDIGFASVMCRLDLPHRRVHSMAEAVLQHAERGEQNQARELIRRTEQGDLSTVIRLFEEARTAFRDSQKEVAVVLTDGRRQVSVTVDRVVSVEPIDEDTMTDAPAAMGGVESGLGRRMAHRANGQGIVMLLDAEALLVTHCAQTG